jgi:hypothetical protein
LTGDSDEPGELVGYGPIPAGLARRIADNPDSTWQRLITDPLGVLIDYGRERYSPPEPLTDFVQAKHRTCTFPTCNRPAVNCELDHALAWQHGGTTCEANLTPVCLRHHQMKHKTGWTIHHEPATATVTWTSPTHHTYRNPKPGWRAWR